MEHTMLSIDKTICIQYAFNRCHLLERVYYETQSAQNAHSLFVSPLNRQPPVLLCFRIRVSRVKLQYIEKGICVIILPLQSRSLRCGVGVSIVVSHTADRGSSPRIGSLFFELF